MDTILVLVLLSFSVIQAFAPPSKSIIRSTCRQPQWRIICSVKKNNDDDDITTEQQSQHDSDDFCEKLKATFHSAREWGRDAFKSLTELSLKDYKWRSSVFKSNEADRLMEQSLARMRGEDASYVRPMDATDEKLGPLVCFCCWIVALIFVRHTQFGLQRFLIGTTGEIDRILAVQSD